MGEVDLVPLSHHMWVYLRFEPPARLSHNAMLMRVLDCHLGSTGSSCWVLGILETSSSLISNCQKWAGQRLKMGFGSPAGTAPSL